MGNTIPDHLRASIMRLVESQEQEAQEVERALRAAHGVPMDEGDEETHRAVKVTEGEESGDDSGDKVVVSVPVPASSLQAAILTPGTPRKRQTAVRRGPANQARVGLPLRPESIRSRLQHAAFGR